MGMWVLMALRGEEAAVSWGGAASKYGMHPLGDEVGDVSAKGEGPGAKPGPIGGAKGMGVEMTAPVLGNGGTFRAIGNEPRAKGGGGEEMSGGSSDGVGNGNGGIEVGVGRLREEGAKEVVGALGWR